MPTDLSPQALRTRASVLDCAVGLFAEHGTHGLTMTVLTLRISTTTGTDLASLRRAFPTLFDLAHAVVLRSIKERVHEELEADNPEAPPEQRMAALVRRHLEAGWEHRTAMTLTREVLPVLRAIQPARYREIAALIRTYREHIRAIVTTGVADNSFRNTDPRRAADEILKTCDSLLYWYTPDEELGSSDMVAVYVDLIVHHQLDCPRP